jgi:hypothetical protein
LITSFRVGMRNSAAKATKRRQCASGAATPLAWHRNGRSAGGQLGTVVTLSRGEDHSKWAQMDFGGRSSPTSTQRIILEVLFPFFQSSLLGSFLTPNSRLMGTNDGGFYRNNLFHIGFRIRVVCTLARQSLPCAVFSPTHETTSP